MEKCRVILMDDDNDDLLFLREAMEDSGHFDVLATCSAENELIAALNKERLLPDAIICDLHIPPYNGIALHYKLRALDDYASVPFILLSGTPADQNILHAASDEGLSTFFIKPITIKGYVELCAKLFECIA